MSTGTGTQQKTIVQAYNRYPNRPEIQFGANGGASFFNGNASPAFYIYGSALWGGNTFKVGPIGGYEQVSDAPAGSIGGHGPGQTFVNQTLRSRIPTFGAQFVAETWRGVTLEGSGGLAIVRQTEGLASGFCGLGNATSPAGCHVLSMTTTQNTGVGAFAQGGFSFALTQHISLTTGLRYVHQPAIKSPSSSGSSISVNQVTPWVGLQIDWNRPGGH